MARTRLQRCKGCGKYGLEGKCPECGGSMEAVAPLKFSPEDPQGARRRKRVDAGSDEWVKTLPSSRKEEE
ncbi:MAG TPA: nucleolar RNA-binding Nop10p family protein [Candidatus Thalassarchaeaceae archaeon]|jgi:rRNA maturation protein Nop10|nr:nucleolar RNA-binding Nop10p family protein [Candidatus Thalassarchaeaceae archaeon]|tara:strand:+ start:17633 stop:17842 length:210 start_codon:yes stop_codon:yes gene_type:complete